MPDGSRTSNSPPGTPTTATPAKARANSIKRPSPRLYFAHFVDHTEHFVRFLETVARKRWGQALENASEPLPVEGDPNADEQAEKRDQVAVWNTLFELYLSHPPSSSASPNSKALALLQNTTLPYDPTHALILCSTRGFTAGLVLLWERMGMHEDVVRFFMDRHHDGDADASSEVVRRVRQYGAGRPQLYPLVLRFLTSTPALLAKHRDDVADVLRVIDEEKIMPPVSVVQVLSRNGVASVGLVKEWLMARIQSARQEVDTVSSFGRPLASWVLTSIHDRTNSSSPRIGQRPRRNCARSRSSRTPTTRVSSTSLSVQHVKAGWTSRPCTSCATTATTNGASRALSDS